MEFVEITASELVTAQQNSLVLRRIRLKKIDSWLDFVSTLQVKNPSCGLQHANQDAML
jgi:hypothetical protein